MSPEELRSRTFTIRKLVPGYDVEEVHALLRRAASTLDELAAGRPSPELLTGEQVTASRFQDTKFRPGYDQDEVDDFLDGLVRALDAAHRRPGPSAPPALGGLTGRSVREHRFLATKFREGYAMEQVDALLERAAAALVEAEAGPGLPAPAQR